MARRLPQLWLRLDGRGPAWGQIYRALKHRILSGALAPGERLPSTRALASHLGVSRNTTGPVYDQLIAEGYLAARRGSGTFVAELGPGSSEPLSRRGNPKAPERSEARPLSRYGARITAEVHLHYDDYVGLRPVPYDFIHGVPEAAAFPRSIWRRLVSRQIKDSRTRSLGYGAPEGIVALREAIAAYLADARGVRCRPDQLIVTSGIQQAITLVARILVDPGDAVLLEEAHHLGARSALAAEGAVLQGAPLDDEGIDISSVAPATLRRCRLAYVTPSHQFPTGVVLSLRRRLELLEWAERSGAHVIEDDYDSELRYGGRPIEALQALDGSGRVIYVGTFSKSLSPALRIGYIVAPPPLVAPLRLAKWIADWSTPTLYQEVLASFLIEGHFARHLRRLKHRYAARRAALRHALEQRFGGRVAMPTSEAGLHLPAWFRGVSPKGLRNWIAAARKDGVGVYSLSPYYLSPPRRAGLLLGYTLVDETRIPEGVRRLAGARGAD